MSFTASFTIDIKRSNQCSKNTIVKSIVFANKLLLENSIQITKKSMDLPQEEEHTVNMKEIKFHFSYFFIFQRCLISVFRS